MKCGALVRKEVRGKKNKLKTVLVVSAYNRVVMNMDVRARHPSMKDAEDSIIEECDGEVLAQISIDHDGGCSCCGSSWIEIQYTCKKCGNTHFPELPSSEEDVSKLLTARVGLMSEETRSARLVTLKTQEDERQKRFEEERKKMDAKLLASRVRRKKQ